MQTRKYSTSTVLISVTNRQTAVVCGVGAANINQHVVLKIYYVYVNSVQTFSLI